MAVRPAIDVTFATALRTVLRQDPDIIMVGEIRDTETAEYAVQAALTGHLVLSTLHTNDAPSSITRLLDLKIPGFLITSTVLGDTGAAPGSCDLRSLRRRVRAEHGGGAGTGYRLPHAVAANAEARQRMPSLPSDRLYRARRHLRNTAHHGRHSPLGGRKRRQHEALQGRPQRGHAHPSRVGHRQSAGRDHDRQRDGPRYRGRVPPQTSPSTSNPPSPSSQPGETLSHPHTPLQNCSRSLASRSLSMQLAQSAELARRPLFFSGFRDDLLRDGQADGAARIVDAALRQR